MRAEVYNVAFPENYNALYIAYRTESVGYYEHSAFVHKLVYRLLNERLAIYI